MQNLFDYLYDSERGKKKSKSDLIMFIVDSSWSDLAIRYSPMDFLSSFCISAPLSSTSTLVS